MFKFDSLTFANIYIFIYIYFLLFLSLNFPAFKDVDLVQCNSFWKFNLIFINYTSVPHERKKHGRMLNFPSLAHVFSWFPSVFECPAMISSILCDFVSLAITLREGEKEWKLKRTSSPVCNSLRPLRLLVSSVLQYSDERGFMSSFLK